MICPRCQKENQPVNDMDQHHCECGLWYDSKGGYVITLDRYLLECSSRLNGSWIHECVIREGKTSYKLVLEINRALPFDITDDRIDKLMLLK
jgi:hypothetical protein